MKPVKYIVQFILAVLFVSELQAQQKLSLQDALALALENNPAVRSSALDLAKAGQQRVIAPSLFLTSVYAGGQATHHYQLPAFFGLGENEGGDRIPYGRFGGKDQFAASVSAVQPLYSPLANPSWQYAKLREQQSALGARAKEIEVLSDIKDTYLRILVLQERIRLTQESINRNQKALQDSRLLFFQGKGLRVDTLRAYTS